MRALISLLIDEPLRMFLPARHRGGAVRDRHDGTSSVGHLVQSAGVPLPEIGRLVVGGSHVFPSYRPGQGDVVHVQPVSRPQPLPPGERFVLDVHLGSLARRLRLLGVDVAYERSADDVELVNISLTQTRVLLTKDRGLLARRALEHAAFVRGSAADEQLADVLDRFAPALAPFARCIACNGLVRRVPKDSVLSQLEPGTAHAYDEFARCVDCARIYWRGAHAQQLDDVVRSAASSSRVPRSN